MQKRYAYLAAMGIQSWAERESGAKSSAVSEVLEKPKGMATAMIDASPAAADDISTLDWEQLAARVANCTRCPLYATRTQTVFGTGDRNAELMLIGEAPGAEEDRQGEPFVGAAGKLLNAMLAAIGIERRQVYIANILKSRPPGNRDPKPEEVAMCYPYLQRQIALVQPRLLVALGRIAAQNLLNTTTPLGRLRGQWHRWNDTEIPLLVTYHPAYLLRNPVDKSKSWQDLKRIRNFLHG